jgi:hypothetical protein
MLYDELEELTKATNVNLFLISRRIRTGICTAHHTRTSPRLTECSGNFQSKHSQFRADELFELIKEMSNKPTKELNTCRRMPSSGLLGSRIFLP